MDMHFEGVIFHTYAAELARRIAYPYPPFAVLDVRDQAAFESERIPGAMHHDPEAGSLPAGTTEATELFVVGADPEDPTVRRAARALRRHGARRVVEVIGGMLEWKQKGLPLERGRGESAA